MCQLFTREHNKWQVSSAKGNCHLGLTLVKRAEASFKGQQEESGIWGPSLRPHIALARCTHVLRWWMSSQACEIFCVVKGLGTHVHHALKHTKCARALHLYIVSFLPYPLLWLNSWVSISRTANECDIWPYVQCSSVRVLLETMAVSTQKHQGDERLFIFIQGQPVHAGKPGYSCSSESLSLSLPLLPLLYPLSKKKNQWENILPLPTHWFSLKYHNHSLRLLNSALIWISRSF